MNDDLISRQAAIDAICKDCYFYDVCYEADNERCKDIAKLRDFPPAQSAQTPCDLCAYNPPSSGDGKPCSMCPASAKRGE